MQKILLTISLIAITSPILAQQKAPLNHDIIDRIQARYKNAPTDYESLTDIISKLIDEKKFGPELADFLDLKMALGDYTYKGKGVYEFVRGTRLHYVSRHLCEAGVTKQEVLDAQRLHEKEELTQNDGFASIYLHVPACFLIPPAYNDNQSKNNSAKD